MLALHILLALCTAALFAALAILLGRRRVSAEVRPAIDLFRLWWGALAVRTGLDAAGPALLDRGMLPIWLYQTLRDVELIVICIGLWALLCYLVYTYSGRRASWRPLAGVYAGFAIFLLALVNRAGAPHTLVIEHGDVTPVPGLQLSGAAMALIILLLVGPQVAAAAAYAGLYPRASTATQRYRIALVSVALLVWLGTTLLANVLQAAGGLWAYGSRALGLLAAVLVLLAYFPLRSVQRRYGVVSLGHEDAPVPAPAGTPST